MSFESKSKQLEQVKEDLKKEFFGIDDNIDEIIEAITPWYMEPKALRRPIIVNLWGMTGSGKTSVVRNLAKKLNQNLIELDFGEYARKEQKTFSRDFFEKYFDFSESNSMIFIDELHSCRTIAQDGTELDRSNIRGFWSLLSDGKIVLNNKGNVDFIELLREIEHYYNVRKNKMETYEKEMKGLHKNSKRYKNLKTALEALEGESWKYLLSVDWSKSPRFIVNAISSYLKIKPLEIIKMFEKDFEKALYDFKEKIEALPREIQPTMDFSKSLIFLAGNLDGLYSNDGVFDPDQDLETYHKSSLEITVSDVKTHLSKYFRNEQIGRFGNNHIIYPSLNKEAYEQVVENEIGLIQKYYKDHYDLNFSFSKSINKILFNEGVVPAQGVRSVLSSVSTLLESAIIQFVTKYKSTKGKKTKNISVTHSSKTKCFNFDFKRNNKPESFSFKIKLRIDEFRKPKITERSVCTAIHEAGHILNFLVECKEVPSFATVFTVGYGNDGIVYRSFSSREENKRYFEYQEKEIVAILGGWAAEYVVNGKNKITTGAACDIQRATKIMLDLFGNCGYGNSIARKSKSEQNNHASIKRRNKDEVFVSSKIDKFKDKAIENAEKHKALLVDLTEALLSNVKLTKVEIAELAKKHHIDIEPDFSYISKFDEFKKRSNDKNVWEEEIEEEAVAVL